LLWVILKPFHIKISISSDLHNFFTNIYTLVGCYCHSCGSLLGLLMNFSNPFLFEILLYNTIFACQAFIWLIVTKNTDDRHQTYQFSFVIKSYTLIFFWKKHCWMTNIIYAENFSVVDRSFYPNNNRILIIWNFLCMCNLLY